MTPLQHYQLSLLFTSLTSVMMVCIGLGVIFMKGYRKDALIFSIYSTLVGIWSWCQLQAGNHSVNPSSSLFWVRIMFYAVITFPLLLSHFFEAILGINKRKTRTIGWFVVLGFSPFIASNYFLREGGPVGFLLSFPRAGPLFLPFNLAWIGGVVYALSLLAQYGPRHPNLIKRKQAWLLMVFFLAGYLVGSTNYLYLYGIYLFPLQPFATYGVAISWIILAYIVFAYGIFDIKVVIRKSLIYSILVRLLTIGYFVLIYSVERIFRTSLGYNSIWISLIAFALMALLFQPLKIAVQRFVDQLVFRMPQEQLLKKMEWLEEQAQETDRFKAVSTMAAGLCHELRNPLQVIQTHAEFLPEMYDDPKFRSSCSETMKTEIIRINDLLTQLMEFAKPKSPKLKEVHPNDIIESTLNMLTNEFVQRKIKLEKKLSLEIQTIHADPDQLRQIILNLTLNALQAIHKRGTITVTTYMRNNHFMFEIADTGPGIASEVISKLFQPFATTKTDGNGLGLSIVQNIVHQHHGTISLKSRLGLGATFVVQLPIS